MRVLFVTHAFPRASGDLAGSFILHLARALVDDGANVLVLAPSAPALAPSAVIDGVPVIRFRYAPRRRETLAYTGTFAEQVAGSLGGKLALAGLLAAGTLSLRRTVASFQPDLVHAHWWFPSGLIALGARLRQPLVTTMHGSDVRLARTSAGAPALFRRVMAGSDAVTTVSSWLAAEARALAPGLGVTVEPMPVDVALFGADGGSATGQGSARIDGRLLFVGRLNAQKGIALLLDALAASAPHVTLDVVGDGEDRALLQARAGALGIASRVRWLGTMPQERLVPLYRAASAVVIPSENEGLGLVAVEAQLCETPVIAWRSGGLVDLVEDGVSGLLTPPRDVPALAAAIDDLLSHPDRAAALGRAGRAASIDRFAPSRVAARYRGIYERALAVAREHDAARLTPR